ncbi:MAG: ComEC family competence protein [Rhodospirillaceae bacterium]|nr:ComEC family competence protein [Rhodospirillaceae bacterium]
MSQHLKIIINQFLADRDRWVLWLPVFVGLGVGSYFSLNSEPPAWTGILIVLAAGLTVYFRRQNFIVLCGGVVIIAIAIGFSAAQWRTLTVAHPVLQKRIGPTTISGRILQVENFENGPRITLEKIHLAFLAPYEMPQQARLKLRGNQPDFAPGQWIKVRGVLTPPPAPVMPGSFDFQRRFYFMEIGATGFGMGKATIIQRSDTGASNIPISTAVNLFIAELRHEMAEKIRRAIPGAIGGVAAALMTGDRSGIPKSVLEAFRQSGLAHLLAISGLHIGLVAGLLFGGIRTIFALIPAVALRQPIKKWAAFLAILGAFAYAVMAGATVPTQRAFLMISLVLMAVIVDRQGISLRLVAWAALAILLLRPESLLGASFQLSFAAVIALIAAYEFLKERNIEQDRTVWWRRPVRYIAGIALTTIIATAATSPFAIYHFNQLAQFGLFANVLAVPVTALWIMPWAIVSFLLLPLGLAEFGLIPMGWGVELIITIAQTIAGWKGAVVIVPALPVSALVAVGIGGLWLCLWRQKWRLGGAGLVVLGFSSVFFVSSPDIVVEERGKLFAVKGSSGTLHLSSQRVSKFAGETWLRRVGQSDQTRQNWPKQGFSQDKSLTCDRLGCIFLQKGHKVALITDSQAVPEDCQSADIVVSAVPVPWHCPSAELVIDWFDLWRHGAHAIWLRQEGVLVENVNGKRGHRPWVLRPREKEK